MIKVLLILGVLAIIAVLVYAVVSRIQSRAETQVVRRRELREARRALLTAEKTINDVQRLALTNMDFQPHLAGVVLMSVQEYADTKQKKLS